MFDVIIIGAGIVGLSTAYKLLGKYSELKILIIEKENNIAQHQTGNNSGVIHSGIYYKPGSKKAISCTQGYLQLINFCDEYNINYKLCGKVIVATNENEFPYLEKIYNNGIRNGLQGLNIITPNEIKALEPNINGIKGIFVPQTGIIDYKEVSNKIKELIILKSGKFEFNNRVTSIRKQNNMFTVYTNKNKYQAKNIISCAGLYSDKIARMTSKNINYKIIPFRGEYYKLKPNKSNLINTLVYPVPNPEFPFLGVHFTTMLNGDVEAGPNAVLAFAREGYKKYNINIYDLFEFLTWKGFRIVAKRYWYIGFQEFYRSFSKKAFVKELNKLLPVIQKDDLISGGAGIRAQACHIDGNLIDDFYFIEDENLLHVCNAPSPAATSCFSIAETIVNKTNLTF